MQNAEKTRSSEKYDEAAANAAWILIDISQSKVDAQTALRLSIGKEEYKKRTQSPPPLPLPVKKPPRHRHQDHQDTGNNNNALLVPRATIDPRALPDDHDELISIPPVPSRPIPESLSDIMGACSVPLYKDLQRSDLSPGLSKVTIFKKQVQKYLLPMLEPRDGSVAGGIKVVVYDWEGKEFPMEFKSWADEKTFVLTCGWNELCTYHRGKDTLMEPGNVAVLWMFRKKSTGQICFAVNVVKMSPRMMDQFMQRFVDKYHDGIRTDNGKKQRKQE